MKKILYSLFALLLCCDFTIAQTLMSDEDHRIMMNEYAVNLNTVLTAELPQGITIDQFKKKIVNGELTLSSTANASVLTYAEPLKTYGAQFATAKNLMATTDAEKIFLSSFAPSTIIDSSGNLVESATVAGLTASQMWECAIETLDSGGCSPFGVVGGNKLNINFLAETVTSRLTNNIGILGVFIMVNTFRTCTNTKAYSFEGVTGLFNYIESYHLNNNNSQYENNILKFPSWEKYYETIDVLDDLIDSDCDKFDATVSSNITDDQYDSLASKANFDEDNILIDLENSLGFYSLRKRISIEEDNWLGLQGDGQWDANADPDNHFIDDETERTLLSVNAELIVGDNVSGWVYYKFLDDNGGMIQVNNWDIQAIIQISNGIIPTNNANVVIFESKTVASSSSRAPLPCSNEIRDDSYYTNGSNRIKRKSKVINNDKWSHKKISALTIGYKKKNGRWKRRRTWITAGITGIDGLNQGVAYNSCSTSSEIDVLKIKEKRRRRVKVKERGAYWQDLYTFLVFGLQDDKIYSYHKQETLTVITDYYDMPKK